MRQKRWHKPAILSAIIATSIIASTIGSHTRIGETDIYPPNDVPGITNPDITQSNIQDNICNPNWHTKSIRPPSSYTSALKIREMQKYNLPGSPSDYELDHLIALTDGGNPTSEQNLWMQPHNPMSGGAGASVKDQLEPFVNEKICSREWTLKQGQECLTNDWFKCYQDNIKVTFGATWIDWDDD